MQSILDEKLKCPKCGQIITVGDADPDIDGDGSLGCPDCLVVLQLVIDEESE